VLFGGILFLCSLPIQAFIGVLIAGKLGRPVLYRQARPGKNGEIFTLLKFRTMKNVDPGSLDNTDAARMTKFGRALRSSSLDELPSLWNVIKGDMSLVGPRPLLVEYLDRYTAEQARRHEVRPGITGLAQVNGRNEIGWMERLELDVQYVDTYSLCQDFRILVSTLIKVGRSEGISAAGEATMSEFRGNSVTQNQSGGDGDSA
jgi:lipopolysaccharide/colanic/teichoic acid biosynthesis glycosyltransferase